VRTIPNLKLGVTTLITLGLRQKNFSHSFQATLKPARLSRFQKLLPNDFPDSILLFGGKAVVDAKLTGEVVSVNNKQIEILLNGTAKCVQPPSGETNPYSGNRITKERGVELKVRGRLTYERSSKKFSRFDMVAFGNRWGSATYNFRSRDMGPAPIGFAFEKLPTKPQNMTRPKFLAWDYFETL
jgi:hypothetical protein